MIGPIIASALIQYVAITAPVFVPAVADAPQTCDRWAPRYVDRVHAKPRTVDYRSGPTVPAFVPTITIEPLTWKPTYPDRLRRVSLRTSAHQALASAPFQPPQVFDSGGAIIATGSIKGLLQYQALTGPFQETTAPAPDVVPFGAYVDVPVRRRGVHVSRQQAWAFDAQWEAPAAPTVPDLVGPVLRDQPVRRAYPRATYVQYQPIFGVTVPVPVLSWTGRYPDAPIRRRVRFQPEPRPFPLDYDATINPPSPVLGWEPRYPSRLSRQRPRLEGLTAAPIFIPEVTTGATPALSWTPEYADFARAPRRLRASQPAFFFDRFTAPDEVIAPDLAVAVFADRVHARRPITSHPAWMAPVHVPDVTDPVPALAWEPLYPDQIWTRVLTVDLKPAWTGVVFIDSFVPEPVIGEIAGRGSFQRKIRGRGSYHTTIRGRGSL